MSIAENYRIVSPLTGVSSGKFGAIFKGSDKRNGSPVIIKSLVKASSDISAIERLRNESGYSFNKPGLPVILDYYESDHESILIRSYSEGQTLDQFWNALKRKQRLPFLKEFFRKMNEILTELEKNHVVHCDLRPGNILIEGVDQFTVHLLDFGLAIDNRKPEKRKLLFPLGYAAPELLLNHLELVNTRTDIFSLGVIIWRLYAGTLPLAHPNPSIFTNLQLTHPLPDHSQLPKGMLAILNKMSAKHQFDLPPNKMDKNEVDQLLGAAIDQRYHNLMEVIRDLDQLPQPFYRKISLR